MKRHLNTSYRLVWNHITGTLVVASELARSRGKCAGVAVALSLTAVTSVQALAADTVVQAGEAAGIAACLMTYSHHACRTECYAMTVHYYRLRDYALQHPECSAIMRIID